jgi:hypothetical protein
VREGMLTGTLAADAAKPPGNGVRRSDPALPPRAGDARS